MLSRDPLKKKNLALDKTSSFKSVQIVDTKAWTRFQKILSPWDLDHGPLSISELSSHRTRTTCLHQPRSTLSDIALWLAVRFGKLPRRPIPKIMTPIQ